MFDMNKNYFETFDWLPPEGNIFKESFFKTKDFSQNNIKQVYKTYRYENHQKILIFIGTATCGLGAGAGESLIKIKEFVEKHKLNAEVVEVGCIGICSSEPIVDIKLQGKNRLVFGNVQKDDVEDLLEKVLLKSEIPEQFIIGQYKSSDFNALWKDVPFLNEHPFFKSQKRIVLKNCGVISPTSIDQYIATGGYQAFLKAIFKQNKEEICNIIEESGLRGRGGGGFLTGKKWKFALYNNAEEKYFICNADEGDPGAFMDRGVIEGDPYRLLEGLSIGAYAIGANTAYIYIRAEYPIAIKRLEEAIKTATKYGLLGKNILGSGFDLKIRIKKGSGAFVCGEETALMASIEGKRGMPRPRPPFPAQSGLWGKPTIINNVETLANIPDIINNGANWFSLMGTKNSKGTKVFAVSGKVCNTGLVEVEMGTLISDIIFQIAGGIPEGHHFKAVQIGGPSGGCIPNEHIDLEIDYETLQQFGAIMGSGGLVVMDESTCMVDVAKYFMTFIQNESCGKCIPCREGTKQMLRILKKITSKPGKYVDELDRFNGILQLEKLANIIKKTSLCGLGQTAPNPVLSTIKWFEEEYEEHIFERKCRAKVCSSLLTYEIEEDKCTGCTLCARNCPTNAIMGRAKSPHYIIPDKCISCGNCKDVCKFDAVKVS